MSGRPLLLIGLALVTLAGLPGLVQAQIIEPRRALGRYQQFVWNDQHGLPQNGVRALVKTRDGYLWMGTDEGLVRFDGVRFTVFDRSNTPELRSHTIVALLEDREGALWLGTQAGIARLKDGRCAWVSVPGIADDHINAIAEDRHGALWFGTFRSGVLRLAQGRFTAFTTANGLPHNQVWALAHDAAGRLWIGTSAGLVVRDDARMTTFTVADGLPDNVVRALRWDREGRLWVGTNDGVACRFGDRFGAPNRLRIDSAIEAIAEDREGSIWIGTDRAGLYRYAAGVLTAHGVSDGLPGDKVDSVYPDPDGNIWLGTNGWGLIELKEPSLHTTTTQDGLSDNTVRAVMQERNGSMWIGTMTGLTRLANGTTTTYTARDGLVGGVRALGQDAHGGIWVGTRPGIRRFARGRLELASEFPTQLVAATLTGRDDAFWIATFNDGLYRLRDGRIDRHFTTKDGLPADELLAVYEDSRGAIWVGAFNRGMSRIDHDRVTTWTTQNGLASNYVIAFCEDGAGTMWIGTHGGGLHRFKNGRFSIVTMAQGLYDNLAFHLLDDGRGSLWMLGNRGIYRATLQSLNDVADGKASRVASFAYGVADGMLSREGNGGGPAALKARDGRLWFATMGGAVAIDPREVDDRPPALTIEGVTVDRIGMPVTGAVHMKPRQENIEIHYTALSWRRPQQVRFRYRLIGLDRDWVEAGARRTAYYSHLPPGRYTFQVIADNGDGVWNLEGRTLTVAVAPAFHQQWWFAPLLGVGAGVGLALAWRRRLGQIRERQAVQQAFARQLIASQEAERKRIAAELHDGLGQHLVVIRNLALLSLNGADDAEREQHITSISEGASQAMREVREISHNLRPYQLDRLGLTLALQGIVKTASVGSAVVFTSDIQNVDDALTKEAEINLYRVVQESVNNVVKHAEATTASVHVRRDGRHVQVTVADDGRGFAPAATSTEPGHGGFGLLGMSERVRLLGGAIRVESEPGQGTMVTIDIDTESQAGV